MFFEKFEQNILFCSLVQFGFFYSNSIFCYSNAHNLSPAYQPPCKTLESRRMDLLEYFWSMKLCLLLSVQKWFSQKLALSSFQSWPTNLTTLFCIQRDYDLEILSFSPSFQIWSSLHFCTTTYLNISLKLPPKLWDVSSSI